MSDTHVKYMVPINSGIKEDGTEESVTIDIVQLVGGRRKRKRLFRKYLKQKFGIVNAVPVIKALGFTDLL